MLWKNKELVMTKTDSEDFQNSTTDNDYFDDDVIVKDYCHITGK